MIFVITRENGEVCELSCDDEITLLMNIGRNDVARLKNPDIPVAHAAAKEVTESEEI